MPLMNFRPHRGSLAESMAESVKIEATMAALEEHVKKTVGFFQKDEVLKVKPYANGEPDNRIGWEKTYIVLGKEGVYGWCDTQPRAKPYFIVPVVKTSQGVTYEIKLIFTDNEMFDYELQNKEGTDWKVYNREKYKLFDGQDEKLIVAVTLKTSTKSLKEALRSALIVQRRRYLAKKKRTDKIRKK